MYPHLKYLLKLKQEESQMHSKPLLQSPRPEPKKATEETQSPPLVIHDGEQEPPSAGANDSLKLLSDFRRNGSRVMFPPINSNVKAELQALIKDRRGYLQTHMLYPQL